MSSLTPFRCEKQRADKSRSPRRPALDLHPIDGLGKLEPLEDSEKVLKAVKEIVDSRGLPATKYEAVCDICKCFGDIVVTCDAFHEWCGTCRTCARRQRLVAFKDINGNECQAFCSPWVNDASLGAPKEKKQHCLTWSGTLNHIINYGCGYNVQWQIHVPEEHVFQ